MRKVDGMAKTKEGMSKGGTVCEAAVVPVSRSERREEVMALLNEMKAD